MIEKLKTTRAVKSRERESFFVSFLAIKKEGIARNGVAKRLIDWRIITPCPKMENKIFLIKSNKKNGSIPDAKWKKKLEYSLKRESSMMKDAKKIETKIILQSILTNQ